MVQLAVIKPPKDFTFNSNGVVRVLERLPASSYTPQVLYIVFELTDAMVNSGHSLIYMERYDSSTMSSVSNKYVNHPNVKAIFKHYVQRRPTRQKRAHIDPTQCYDNHSSIIIHPEKLRCVPWALKQYTHLLNSKMLKLYPPLLLTTPKPFDVFYVVHSHTKHPALHAHRRAVVISKEKKSVVRTDVPCHEYLELLKQSKVCIAPYGLGERISLDQLGMLAECIIIKPPMTEVVSVPNIYEEYPDSFRFTCDAKWSDLSAVIDSALASYNPEVLRINKAHLLATYTHEYYEAHFYSSLSTICSKIERLESIE